MKITTFVKGPIDANNYLLVDEETNEAVLIDCSSAEESYINEIKQSGVNLKYILLTHGHFDHVLGVDKFKKVFGTDVYVSKEDLSQVKLVPDMMQMFAGMVPVNISDINKFVADGDEFFIGKTKIRAIATPGHTQGGICYFTDNSLFSGDTLFQGSVGRCDLLDGDFKQITESIKNKLFGLPDDVVVYPGHGPKTSIGYEKKYNEIVNL